MKYIFVLIALFSVSAFGVGPEDCGDMEIWDYATAMCAPYPMAGMRMKMGMVHGNAFLVGISESGPRGTTKIAAPNMVMLDLGSSLGDYQYVNLDVMGTAELWTFPKSGYPELLQVGEENADHV